MVNSNNYCDILDVIKYTPLVSINNLLNNPKYNFLLKYEFLNSFNTIDARIINEIIDSLLTNGNCIDIDKIETQDKNLIKIFKQLYNLKINNNKYLNNFKKKKSEIINLDYHLLQKKYYINVSNQIFNQCNGNIDVIFIPVTSIGLISGIGSRLKALLPDLLIIGVLIKKENQENKEKISSFSDRSMIDICAEVDSSIINIFQKKLSLNNCINCGKNSSAIVLSILKYIDKNNDKNKNIIGILTD